MAKRTVYARYGDKTTLFKAALTRAIEEWIVPVEVLQQAESDDLETHSPAGRSDPGGQCAASGRPASAAPDQRRVGQMPEIAAFNVQKGTEPTLEYLADLFRRRLGRDGHRRARMPLMPRRPSSTSSSAARRICAARGVVMR